MTYDETDQSLLLYLTAQWDWYQVVTSETVNGFKRFLCEYDFSKFMHHLNALCNIFPFLRDIISYLSIIPTFDSC